MSSGKESKPIDTVIVPLAHDTAFMIEYGATEMRYRGLVRTEIDSWYPIWIKDCLATRFWGARIFLEGFTGKFPPMKNLRSSSLFLSSLSLAARINTLLLPAVVHQFQYHPRSGK